MQKFIAVNTRVDDLGHCIRVEKTAKITEPDENSYARLADRDFHNGVIRVKCMSRLLPDAPPHARGFIGLAFRINGDDSAFECFYVRPANGRSCTDPVRRHRGCQYFSYPGYTFAYFRDRGISDYENGADIELGEWMELRVEIRGSRGDFYVNDSPALSVENMFHGDSAGGVGIFVDEGTEGFFKELQIEDRD